ncbi:solute carrier family 36 (proton-coupled amino acid transporter) [Paragonimus westermani]|uniref:Solute carrier family 36 (Proton-coupled amino acid transporter) n=1 Tax=Paragonimus westermani TaxID=34504 RepID=A0A5J4NI55_9TREM|nr:solute carrier family 36 (proton-coupled amino acid transporter) [Paragonimus westermani]
MPMNFYLVGFLVALTLVPMCLCNNMRILAYFSIVANVATLLATVLIFVFLFSAGLRPVTSLPVYTSVPHLLIGFSIAMCTFEGISLILPIQNKMANPEVYANPTGVLNVGMVVVIGINAALGFYGFLAIGDTVEGSITLNIGERPYWFAPIKPLFVLAIYVSYVLQYYVPATIFARLMEKIPCHRLASDKRRSFHVNLMRISLVLFTYLMVIAVPKLELMISLIGSFASSVLAFIIPSVLEIVHLWSERTRIRHFWLTVVCKHTLFIFLGLVTFLGGTTVTLFKLIQASGPSHVSSWPVVF